ncbi:MAG: 2-oxoglutarate oxidoreductase [Proteobacteria bacterium]|nr:MAG: 2-oxoglutarate oxidoreductase [Pseudomonadota bacterium]
MYGLKTDWFEDTRDATNTRNLEDYQSATPRWCPGCGDHAVLAALQRLMRDEGLAPDKCVVVSGIGCSSRFPHYLNTYGFHGLHGRALPVAQGVRSRRPDLNLWVVTGDGDCTSIGAGHWIHAIRYNMKMTVMLFDNNIYGLTKMQTSPTTAAGYRSNTHPRGAWLDPIDPIQVALGVTNVSFVAQTADWNPAHVAATLAKAYKHPGTAFVRILQRCPHYTGDVFEGMQRDPARLLLLDHPDGIELNPKVKRAFAHQAAHDPSDINRARELAGQRDLTPIGLFFQDTEAQRYDAFTVEGLATSRADKLAAVKAELDKYKV